MKDFDAFLNAYESLFSTYITAHNKTIEGQFREVKSVMTGVTISIEELDFENEKENLQL